MAELLQKNTKILKKYLHLTDAYDIVIFAVRDNTQRIEIRLRGQAVKTLASHAGIRGSIPLGVTLESGVRFPSESLKEFPKVLEVQVFSGFFLFTEFEKEV